MLLEVRVQLQLRVRARVRAQVDSNFGLMDGTSLVGLTEAEGPARALGLETTARGDRCGVV